MMGYGYGGMAWMWPWILIGALVLLAGLVALVLFIVKMARAESFTSRSHPLPNTAKQILDERYARGEIDDDEYRKRREGLQ